MSNLISPRPRTGSGPRRHFPIVASQFNSTYVQGLIDHATAELRALAAGSSTTLTQVPGSFEIPIVVRELALQKRGDRSEEHTSELQSQSNLVCRLLLEKKKHN